MQQFCTYGSVRGASGNRRPYRDKSRSAGNHLERGIAWVGMRGKDTQQSAMFSYVSPEERVPARPSIAADPADGRCRAEVTVTGVRSDLCHVRASVDCAGEAAAGVAAADVVHGSQRADADGAAGIQPAVPLVRGPEHGRAGVGADGVQQESGPADGRRIAEKFFAQILDQAAAAGLLSDEHFSVDGTLIEAWASQKSFQRKDQPEAPPPDDPGNPTVNFHGEKRRNDTHESKTDPDARLARKSGGHESKLAYCGNVMIENRNGLVVDTELVQCSGNAERDAALLMAECIPGADRATVAADKGYDTRDFVATLREMNVTPHVAQNEKRPGGSAIDGRTTRHAGYKVSQRKRKRIEEVFGWLKTVGMLRKTRHRGLHKVRWVFTFAATAYNLVRMRNLIYPLVQSA